MDKLLNKKLIKILVLFIFAYNIILTFRRIVYLSVNSSAKAMTWNKFLFNKFLVEPMFNIILAIFVVYITNMMLRRNFKWKTIFTIHIFLSLITAIIMYLFHFSLTSLFGEAIVYDNIFKKIINTVTGYINIHFLTYFVFVFITFIYVYVNKTNELELQKVNLKHQLSQSQVQILKYQLHPHFFFNTLNSISSLMDIDTKIAQNTLADFSDLLREILFLKSSNELPLKNELRLLKKYLDIMSVRFSDHLKIEINIEEGLNKIKIPSLILQPIIENSIQYGYSESVDKLEIDLSIYTENNYLYLVVKNNGEQLNDNFKFGFGLKNTEERLKTLYPNNYIFKVENLKGKKGVKTTIAIKINSSSIKPIS